MIVLLPLGVSTGLLIIIFTWFLGTTEKKKISKYIKSRYNALNGQINQNNTLYTKSKKLFENKKQIIDFKISFRTFLLISLAFFILGGVISFPLFLVTLTALDASHYVERNYFAILLMTVAMGASPTGFLYALVKITKKAIDKQSQNAFVRITNNYMVRNNLEAATWDSIDEMKHPIKGIFMKAKKRVDGGENFANVILGLTQVTGNPAFKDFYNVIITSRLYGGNPETLLNRMIERTRKRRNTSSEMKEELNPLVSKAIIFTVVMIGTFFAVQIFFPEAMALVQQSAIGKYYLDSIIIATFLEIGLLVKYLTMED